MTPWFSPSYPFPFWGRAGTRKSIGVGNPQDTLQTPFAIRMGFAISGTFALTGSNASGQQGGSFPATQQAVLNLSAAQIASGSSFNRARGDYD